MSHNLNHWTWNQVGRALPRETRKRMLDAVYRGATLPRELLNELCDAEDAEEDAELEQLRP